MLTADPRFPDEFAGGDEDETPAATPRDVDLGFDPSSIPDAPTPPVDLSGGDSTEALDQATQDAIAAAMAEDDDYRMASNLTPRSNPTPSGSGAGMGMGGYSPYADAVSGGAGMGGFGSGAMASSASGGGAARRDNFGGGRGGAASNDFVDEDGVRAADGSYRDNLLGGPSSRMAPAFNMQGVPPALQAQMQAAMASMQTDLGSGGAGMGMGMGGMGGNLGVGMGGGMMSTNDIPDSDWMFPPPRNLTCAAGGDVREARNQAKDARKWLLVNVQSVDIFDSHRLNRDTWSNETIQTLLDSSFVFWQRSSGCSAGADYIRLYKVSHDDLPHIAIIGPTGATLWSQTGFIQPDELSMALVEFIEQNDLDATTLPKPKHRCVACRGNGRRTDARGEAHAHHTAHIPCTLSRTSPHCAPARPVPARRPTSST